MIKELSLLFGIVLIVCYLAFAFVNLDIAWATSGDAVMRVIFLLVYVTICRIAAFAYLESKEKSK